MRRALLLVALAALASCAKPAADRPLAVSIIGGAPALVDPSRGALDAPSAALAGATAQGLIAFDQGGQIEPALAERWIVYDEGRSFIFRLRATGWADGTPITADEVARRLRAMIADRSHNPLKPLLGAIEEVSAVTPRVIEIDLRSPRPYLLQLLAQPAAALLRDGRGSGPMTVAARSDGVLLLRPLPDPDADPEAAGARTAAASVALRGEDAARAVARFALGRADAVLGGSFRDLAIARAAQPRADALRFDPVQGLFGLAFQPALAGFTAEPANRRALAMAIDRDAIGALLAAPGWTPAVAPVPDGAPDLAAPARPSWASDPLPARRAAARAQILGWSAANGAPPTLRVALPAGPGATMLFARIAADWRGIGVVSERVAAGAAADLRLVDTVNPSDSASFYLRGISCEAGVLCAPEAELALEAARNAPTLAARAFQLAQADRLLAEATPFIALGGPIRWSLAGPAASGWRPSPRGLHPLISLRSPPRRGNL